jgi:MoaA/NifB/PqqE/SkfB family radical SAM enzyme
MRKFIFDIDTSGICNLRCPSCPQGNVREYRLPHGFMAPDVLERVIDKAKGECEVERISLFNWAEPLLHPKLPELINVVQAAGIPCHLSSNLSILPDSDALMSTNPTSFRISISGFSQEIYGLTHRGGKVERVKKHMVELAEAKKRQQATTEIYVYYHRYRHNLKEEPLMRRFAEDLGFGFQPVWALFFPLEKILALAGEDKDNFSLTAEDRHLLDRLAVPLDKALKASQKYGSRPCPLREDAISLDFRGNVTLCCGVFDAREFTLGNYLQLPLVEIQRLRQNHTMCERCMRQGAHVYLTQGAYELEELALENIAPEDAELLDLRSEVAWKRRQRQLALLYDRLFSRVISPGQKAALAAGFFRLQRFIRRGRRK